MLDVNIVFSLDLLLDLVPELNVPVALGSLTVVRPSLTFSQELMVDWRHSWMGAGSLGGCVAGVVVVTDFLKLKRSASNVQDTE
jgi:hypothetical protein